MSQATVTCQLHELYEQIADDSSKTRDMFHKTTGVINILYALKQHGEIVHLIVDRNKRPHFGKKDSAGVAIGILKLVDKLTIIETDGTEKVFKDRIENIKPELSNKEIDDQINAELRALGIKIPGDEA